MYTLGIDTSNYTTSVCLYGYENGLAVPLKKLLPVKKGQLGLRQSDAVFHHTQQLPEMLKRLFSHLNVKDKIAAVGVSVRPRDEDGSYMPCFTVGKGAADILGSALRVPVYCFSHQLGHIAAAVYSSGSERICSDVFLAFHVSGGTTEVVLVKPDAEKLFSTEIIAKSLDLHAGQAVDRVGVSLGLSFPCGPELERLALSCKKCVNVKPCIKGRNCCLSGIENICKRLLADGVSREEVSLTCLMFIAKSIEGMCTRIFADYGDMPVLFAGGVMSNTIIKKYLSERFNCIFTEPVFSADNAYGTSVLAYKMYCKEHKI